MPDVVAKPTTEYGCALGAGLFLAGIIIGAWWAGRGAGERFEAIERSQERIRARMYQIETKLEEPVDE